MNKTRILCALEAPRRDFYASGAAKGGRERARHLKTEMNAETNPELVGHLARFMSYAYQRGRLDALGMPDGLEKEQTVRIVGDLEVKRWECSAGLLLSANQLNAAKLT